MTQTAHAPHVRTLLRELRRVLATGSDPGTLSTALAAFDRAEAFRQAVQPSALEEERNTP